MQQAPRLFLGREFRGADEGIAVMHLAAGEGEALDEAVAVEQVPLARAAALEQSGAVAVERGRMAQLLDLSDPAEAARFVTAQLDILGVLES